MVGALNVKTAIFSVAFIPQFVFADTDLVMRVIRTMDQIKPGQAGVSQDLFVEVHADGRPPLQVPGLSFTIDSVQRKQGRLPALGEHTHDVLNELQQG